MASPDSKFEDDEFKGVNTLKTWREVPPTHYILKIESFSSLVRILEKTKLDNYESNVFEACDYNWKLLLYPKGDEKRKGRGHISLYLKIMNDLKPWQSIDALLIFFIYDQLKDKYLSIQDTRVMRFESDRKEWGQSQLVSLNCFRNASNGYLIKDSSVFGVEVFVIGNQCEKVLFHTLRKQSEKVYIWNVEKLSELKETGHFSEMFSVGSYDWKLHLYPKGIPKAKGKYLSIYLCLQDKIPAGFKIHIEFKLHTNDPVDENNKIAKKRGNAWFSALDTAWGFPYFIELDDLRSLIVMDAMKIELQIISMSMTASISSYIPDSYMESSYRTNMDKDWSQMNKFEMESAEFLLEL